MGPVAVVRKVVVPALMAHYQEVVVDLPTGTVTFLFSDVEGSTRLLQALGERAYAEALHRHRGIVRDACGRNGGVEVDSQGDAFLFAFPTATGAVEAARTLQDRLLRGRIRVRLGLHTGSPLLTDQGYVGYDLHRAARIAACGHGGQVLVSAATAALVGREGLRDLGEHRLKDFALPERLFQLGQDEFPPPRSLSQTNLPVPATPFLGRKRELREVVELLRRDDVRLLTLTGAGGTGKTRLGVQAARALADNYPDGIFWVPLAELRKPELVLETAARVLDASSPVAAHIGDKSMLLLLDNFEQVVAAAPSVAELLTSCPKLTVLVTSRESLHIRFEQEYRVPPLVPAEAQAFFVARAKTVKPAFEPDEAVPEICRRLDELPLALELAAARVRALSASQILDRLAERLPLLSGGFRDVPERQRTLRATIEWSYELLRENEQRLFQRFSVFAGGCTLEAAEAICAADLDGLQSLVEKSLVRHSGERFWMLETIREYALERLAATGEIRKIRQRHLEQFVELAEEAEPGLVGDEQARWLARIEAEHDNLRSALAYALQAGDAESALRLTVSTRRFWQIHGYLTEGRQSIDSALSASRGAPSELRANGFNMAGILAGEQGDFAAARLAFTAAAEESRASGATRTLSSALLNLGNLASYSGDAETARTLYRESIDHFATLGDLRGQGLAKENLGLLALTADDPDEAVTWLTAARDLAHEAGQEFEEEAATRSLAAAMIELGDAAKATVLLSESLGMARELGDAHGIAVCFETFAGLAATTHDAARAAKLFGASDAVRDSIGARRQPDQEILYERWLAQTLTQLDKNDYSKSYENGRALTLDEACSLALGADAALAQ
jgi:predicted ATPase/class 3 adenylate cyclase